MLRDRRSPLGSTGLYELGLNELRVLGYFIFSCLQREIAMNIAYTLEEPVSLMFIVRPPGAFKENLGGISCVTGTYRELCGP